MANAIKKNFMIRIMLPFMMSRSIVKLQGLVTKHPDMKELYIKKISALYDRYLNVTDDSNRVLAEDGASKMLTLMEEWLAEPNA